MVLLGYDADACLMSHSAMPLECKWAQNPALGRCDARQGEGDDAGATAKRGGKVLYELPERGLRCGASAIPTGRYSLRTIRSVAPDAGGEVRAWLSTRRVGWDRQRVRASG